MTNLCLKAADNTLVALLHPHVHVVVGVHLGLGHQVNENFLSILEHKISMLLHVSLVPDINIIASKVVHLVSRLL